MSLAVNDSMYRLVHACALATVIFGVGCATTLRRDHLLEPKPEGTRLTALGFIGPGFRGAVDNRVDIEAETSQLRNRLQGDLNAAFADASLHVDVRVLFLEVGASVGYRYSWFTFQFEPDGGGLDHGEPVLNRHARFKKAANGDVQGDHWPWAEGRARLLLPFGDHVLGVSGASFRYEGRRDGTLGWELGTVYDRGLVINWETMVVLRHRAIGFIGPVARLLNLPRGEERANELHYGIVAGTAPGWSEADHALVLRVTTAAGFDDDDLMGMHYFRFPIQAVIAYQQDFEL